VQLERVAKVRELPIRRPAAATLTVCQKGPSAILHLPTAAELLPIHAEGSDQMSVIGNGVQLPSSLHVLSHDICISSSANEATDPDICGRGEAVTVTS